MNKIEALNETTKLLKCVNLPGNKECTLYKGLNHICSLNAEQIDKDFDRIADLFCLIAKSISEEMIDDKLVNLLDAAFDNIKRKDIKEFDNEDDGNTATIYFLRTLKDSNSFVDEPNVKLIKELFGKLCSNLEEMRVLFKIQIHGKELFPIGQLLNYVIADSKFLSGELDEVTFNTLLLALEIFDSESYIQELKVVNNLIDKCNLQCLRYLSMKDVIKLGGDNCWKNNLKNNGVLGLVVNEDNKKKIYIRHTERTYFGTDISDEELEKEYNNSKEKVIAYYHINECSSDIELFSFEQIFERNNVDEIKKVIKLMFQDNAYNVFLENALLNKEGHIQLVNQFTSKDHMIIQKNEAPRTANKDILVDDVLKPYYYKGFGNRFDIILYGTIFKLLRVDSNAIDDIFSVCGSSETEYQNKVIVSWARKLNKFYDSLKQCVDMYFKDVAYARSQSTLMNKKISEIYWMPVAFPIVEIDLYLDDKYDISKDHNKCIHVIAEEDFLGNTRYFDDDKKELTIEKASFFDEEVIRDGEFYIVFDEGKQSYRYIYDVDCLMKLRRRVENDNKQLPELERFKKIDVLQVQQVIRKMKLQERQLTDIMQGCQGDFERISYLRLFHHIICYQLFDSRWQDFFEIINSNQIVEFSNINTVELNEVGTWVVPKERRDTDNALNSIVEKYVRKLSERNRDLFNIEIKYDGERFCKSDGERIEKILFLFDTLQSGSSTKKILSGYFECHSTTKREICNYYCNGKEISMEEIIECNNPKIEIIILYGSDAGEECINQYISTHKFLSRAGKVKIIDRINNKADNTLIAKMESIYPGITKENYSIKEGNYPIIREFNQPKRNVFPEKCLEADKVCSLFVKKPELYQKR